MLENKHKNVKHLISLVDYKSYFTKNEETVC